MARRCSSRERMLEAIACREPDYVPCCFMIFSACSRSSPACLEKKLANPLRFCASHQADMAR